MSGGLVGRVEQLLELAGRVDKEQAEVDALRKLPENTGLDISPNPTYRHEFIVAAVNLVEPLARDWQRLKKSRG